MHTKDNISPNLETLTNDILFKETFAHPDNRKFLEYFLEMYFNYEPGFLYQKLAVSYESILNKTRLRDKSMRGDLVIVIDNRILLSMEMYSVFNKESIKKSEQHIMRIHSTQLNIGDDYKELKKSTQINFIGETEIKIEDEVIKTHRLFDEKYDDGFKIYVVRLDLVDTLGYTLNDRFKRILKFLKFIGAKTNIEREEIAKGDEILMATDSWIEKYQSNESFREFCIKSDEIWAKREGYFEGLDEGEAKSQAQIARSMLADKLDINLISKYTDLSIEEIEKLKAETDE